MPESMILVGFRDSDFSSDRTISPFVCVIRMTGWVDQIVIHFAS